MQVNSSFILVTGSTLQFNTGANYDLDVNAFLDLIAGFSPHLTPSGIDTELSDLERALAIYQGEFMAGFNISSPAFENWLVKTRENLRQQWVGILRFLSLAYHLNGQPELALDYAKRWIEEEPWDEEANRHSMGILSALGHRNPALAQFEICQKRLADDLGIEPELETVRLYQRLKRGSLG